MTFCLTYNVLFYIYIKNIVPRGYWQSKPYIYMVLHDAQTLQKYNTFTVTFYCAAPGGNLTSPSGALRMMLPAEASYWRSPLITSRFSSSPFGKGYLQYGFGWLVKASMAVYSHYYHIKKPSRGSNLAVLLSKLLAIWFNFLLVNLHSLGWYLLVSEGKMCSLLSLYTESNFRETR